jgi:alkaline phosphatase D
MSNFKNAYANECPTLTEMEKARLTMVAPYNLDAWDEYAAEREILYATLKKMNKKVVILAGDTHNAWTSDLYNQQGEQVGLELATSSVSSPGIEQYLNIPIVQLQQFEMAFMTLIDELNDCNLNQRGYLIANFTAQQMQANRCRPTGCLSVALKRKTIRLTLRVVIRFWLTRCSMI